MREVAATHLVILKNNTLVVVSAPFVAKETVVVHQNARTMSREIALEVPFFRSFDQMRDVVGRRFKSA